MSPLGLLPMAGTLELKGMCKAQLGAPAGDLGVPTALSTTCFGSHSESLGAG